MPLLRSLKPSRVRPDMKGDLKVSQLVIFRSYVYLLFYFMLASMLLKLTVIDTLCSFTFMHCTLFDDHLTHLSLASLLWDIGKSNSPRCDAAERGVPSWAILFAKRNFIEKLNKF